MDTETNQEPKDLDKMAEQFAKMRQEMAALSATERKTFMEKAASFASSMASRGITNKKCSTETKQLRQVSCHGDGVNIMPCGNRKESQVFQGSFYCGGCGCGDKQGTQLTDITVNGKENYGKLDYPKVWCPLNMPGFQPYKKNEDDALETRNPRKKDIEDKFGVQYIEQHSRSGEE